MDEIIARAKDSINNILSTQQWGLHNSGKRIRLLEIFIRFKGLLTLNLEQNHWIRPFCRRLKRLMDYNDPLSVDFWVTVCDDIRYVVDQSNNEPKMNIEWHRFLLRIQLEEKLEQRELRFK